MTNGDRGGRLADEILRSIANEYGWPDYKPQEKTVAAVDGETLRSYAGEYQFANGPKVVISVEDGHLLVKLPQGESGAVLPESATSFFSLDGSVPPRRFERKEGNSVELSGDGQKAKRQQFWSLDRPAHQTVPTADEPAM